MAFFLLLSLLAFAAAQNTTVDDSDTQISYSAGDWHSGAICQYTANGSFAPGQEACFNFGTGTPCTSNFMFSQNVGASATLNFKGTGISLNGFANVGASLYNVSLDGATEQVDAFGESKPLACATLWSKAGLSAGQHTVTVTLAGVSPKSQAYFAQNGGGTSNSSTIELDSFIVTNGSGTSSTSGASLATVAAWSPLLLGVLTALLA